MPWAKSAGFGSGGGAGGLLTSRSATTPLARLESVVPRTAARCGGGAPAWAGPARVGCPRRGGAARVVGAARVEVEEGRAQALGARRRVVPGSAEGLRLQRGV